VLCGPPLPGLFGVIRHGGDAASGRVLAAFVFAAQEATSQWPPYKIYATLSIKAVAFMWTTLAPFNGAAKV